VATSLLIYVHVFSVDRHSVVDIANRYSLDGRGIESRWEESFSASVQAGPGAHPASYTICTGTFHGVIRPSGSVEHLSPCSAEVNERVELYVLTPWTIVACSRINFKGKVKVNFTLEQATNAQRVSRGIALLFL
jgi:hypothetical protein